MNKKLLFAAMSLAALTACTDNDFESQKVAEEVGSVQFEVLNNDDAFTRASLNGNKVEFSVTDGDLFTLYHGAELGEVTGYQNATYKASAAEGEPAALTTPSVILPGGAIMVWPVDTMFRIKPTTAKLTLTIPAIQGGKDANDKETIQNQIPYVSDLVEVEPYAAYSETAEPNVIPTAYKTAGYDRKYQIFMRPMASQLNLVADYAGTDATLASLYTGDDPIDPISVTSVELKSTTKFTTEIPVVFTEPSDDVKNQWKTVKNNKWKKITAFNIAEIDDEGKTDKLTTNCLQGNDGCKFLILPQAEVEGGFADAQIVVNTIYGKVVIAQGAAPLYSETELNDAWYRYIAKAETAAAAGETKEDSKTGDKGYKTYSQPAFGLQQTINGFSSYTATKGVAKDEPVGASATRYVKVLLTHLDMSDLHVKSDDQLRAVAKVWEKMGLPSVTVYLDGKGTSNVFSISQKTIETINTINAGATNKFTVKPCNDEGEVCDEIVITGGGVIPNLDFILANVPEEVNQEGPIDPEPGNDPVGPANPAPANDAKKANVVLQTGFNWEWAGTIKVAADDETGIDNIINRGTMANATTEANGKILNILSSTDPKVLSGIVFKNDVPGKWDITTGTIRVQNEVVNLGTLTISKPAQYRQDGGVFTNDALTLEKRFNADNIQQIGTVNNYGVFATVNGGVINNYSLIEHKDNDAKTFITTNQTPDANFANAFATGEAANKMGRINLPYSNKDEDNISISADEEAPYQGFISVTVTGLPEADNKVLKTSAVGKYVNYMIVKSGVDAIALVPADVEYLELDTDHEVYWSVEGDADHAFKGLIVLSDVNVKLGTTLKADVTYLGAEMYVGGTFNYHDPAADPVEGETVWGGYFGDTKTRVAQHYVTF